MTMSPYNSNMHAHLSLSYFFFQEPNITFFWQSNAIFDPFTPRETAENLHEGGRPNYYDVTGNKKTVQPNCASPFFKL